MKISTIQRFIKDELKQDPVFSTVDIVCADEEDSLTKVDTALGLGGDGLIVIIGAPKFSPESSSAKYPAGKLHLSVNVTEAPDLNRTRANCYYGMDLAEYVAGRLNFSKPDPASEHLLVFDTPGIVPTSQDGYTVVYPVPFVIEYQLDDTLPTTQSTRS